MTSIGERAEPRVSTLSEPLEPAPTPARGESEAVEIDRYRRALEATLGVPFTKGNRVQVLKNGREIFPAMLDAIERAEKTIDFLTFVYWTGAIATKFAHALARKAREGLDVDVILDAYGAKKMDRKLVRLMEDAGVQVTWFRPPSWRLWRYDNRTHRKILVCDGRVGFTGGVGIAQEWEGDARNPSEWRDTHFRVEGPAVHGLHAAFLGNWAEVGQRVRLKEEPFPVLCPVGDAYVMSLRSVASVGWSDVATLFQTVVQLAHERLSITTPYFVPDRNTMEMLCDAAHRGVEVEIHMPVPHIDQALVRAAARATLGKLLASGVKVCRYERTMLHTKCITVDRVLAIVGSANLNHRSLRKDDEFCLAIIDPSTVETLDRHFAEDGAYCNRIHHREWRNRDLIKRLKESAVRVLQHEL